ncbi:hypothetical protein GJ496_007383 [Pomphorhynchus laevis]|nr:hypothetical protein GJ496_007383 [Pomphorhynchus laevis]
MKCVYQCEMGICEIFLTEDCLSNQGADTALNNCRDSSKRHCIRQLAANLKSTQSYEFIDHYYIKPIYLKLTKCLFRIKECSYASFVFNNALFPSLSTESGFASYGFENIVNALKEQNLDIERDLDHQCVINSRMVSVYIKANLEPLYILLLEESVQNVQFDFIRKYYVHQRKKCNHNKYTNEKIESNAFNCLDTIITMSSSSIFTISNESPAMADIYLASYLLTFCKLSPLKIGRVIQERYQLLYSRSLRIFPEAIDNLQSKNEDKSHAHFYKSAVFLAFTAFAMIWYGSTKRILQK